MNHFSWATRRFYVNEMMGTVGACEKGWVLAIYTPLQKPKYNSQLHQNHCVIFNGILSHGTLLTIMIPNFTVFITHTKHNLSAEQHLFSRVLQT